MPESHCTNFTEYKDNYRFSTEITENVTESEEVEEYYINVIRFIYSPHFHFSSSQSSIGSEMRFSINQGYENKPGYNEKYDHQNLALIKFFPAKM
jgi:hypothetical protein